MVFVMNTVKDKGKYYVFKKKKSLEVKSQNPSKMIMALVTLLRIINNGDFQK